MAKLLNSVSLLILLLFCTASSLFHWPTIIVLPGNGQINLETRTLMSHFKTFSWVNTHGHAAIHLYEDCGPNCQKNCFCKSRDVTVCLIMPGLLETYQTADGQDQGPLLVSCWERGGKERLNVTFIISPLCAHHAIRVLILLCLQLYGAVSLPLHVPLSLLTFADWSLGFTDRGEAEELWSYSETSVEDKGIREEVAKTTKPRSVVRTS